LLGDSLLALHLFPALAGAAVVALSGLMARELGGVRFAQGLAALCVLVAPDFLVFGTWLSMDAFDQLW
jgi:dolichyl-phosphate-mannose--protein O-mannosyl transferase